MRPELFRQISRYGMFGQYFGGFKNISPTAMYGAVHTPHGWQAFCQMSEGGPTLLEELYPTCGHALYAAMEYGQFNAKLMLRKWNLIESLHLNRRFVDQLEKFIVMGKGRMM